MSVDLTREFHRIDEEVHRRVVEVGEHVMWYEFLELGAGSVYDDIYDEGNPGIEGRTYGLPKCVNTLYAEEIEDQAGSREDGRQPTQNVRLTILLSHAIEAGLKDPGEYQPHLKDVFQYDGRFYEVYRYRVRGRMEGKEVILSVEGVETYVDQEFSLDPGPSTPFAREWPEGLPYAEYEAYASYRDQLDDDLIDDGGPARELSVIDTGGDADDD